MRRIGERIFKFSEADETEVQIDVVSDALTRFANNTIHQNVAEQIAEYFRAHRIRWPHRARDDESHRRRIAAPRSAILINDRKEPAEESTFASDAWAAKYTRVSRYFESTAGATPQDRAKVVARVCKEIARRKQTAAGIFSTGAMQSAIANSRGLFATLRTNALRILDHNDGNRFFRLAKSKFAGRAAASIAESWLRAPRKNQKPRASLAKSIPATTP